MLCSQVKRYIPGGSICVVDVNHWQSKLAIYEIPLILFVCRGVSMVSRTNILS